MAIKESSKFYQTTVRLWPEVGQMDERRRDRAVETIVQLIYLSPFALVGLIWLVLRTDYATLVDSIDRLLILFVAMTLLLLQPFRVRIRLDRSHVEIQRPGGAVWFCIVGLRTASTSKQQCCATSTSPVRVTVYEPGSSITATSPADGTWLLLQLAASFQLPSAAASHSCTGPLAGVTVTAALSTALPAVA